MKLRIGAETENGRTRLDYVKAPSRPHSSPSYTIDTNKADEFVRKYNDQDTNLGIMGTFVISASAIMGWSITFERKQTLKHSILGIMIGTFIGMIMSACISHFKKNSLMEKYKVKNYLP
ncbi:hypothetical protein J6G99_03730 [bacterium]|nr:hypothetical protein [bacterium]